MNSEINKKVLIKAYCYAGIASVSIFSIFIASFLYPIDFLNIINAKNPIMQAYWQALMILTPIFAVILKILK